MCVLSKQEKQDEEKEKKPQSVKLRENEEKPFSLIK